MAKCKFTFSALIVGRGACEVGSSRLYFDVVLYGAGYRKLAIRVFPPKKDFTWSQLKSANCSNEWVRVNDHLEYHTHNFLCDLYRVNMINIETIIQNTCLQVYEECDHKPNRPHMSNIQRYTQALMGSEYICPCYTFPRTYFKLEEK